MNFNFPEQAYGYIPGTVPAKMVYSATQPENPVEGLIWVVTEGEQKGFAWLFTSLNTLGIPQWFLLKGDIIRRYVSEDAPSEVTGSQFNGVTWYKPSEATTYIYFWDGDSGQWVEDPVQASLYDTGNVEIFSSFTLTENTTFSSKVVFYKQAKITVPTGITLTFADGAHIVADTDYIVLTGGTVVYAAGSYEEKKLKPIAEAAPSFNYGHPSNYILSSNSFVFGGSSSFPSGIGALSELSNIGGGYDNLIGNDATASTIAGGAHHFIAEGASHSSVLGGAYQSSYADYSTLGGGKDNKSYSTYGGVFSGQGNEAGDSGATPLDNRSAGVFAGAENKAKALRSFLGAGFQNIISLLGLEAFNGAGKNNTVSGVQSANGAGLNNAVSGAQSVNLAGTGNSASGVASLTHGESAVASGNYAVAIGEFLEATATGSSAFGVRSKAYLRGMVARASGYFAVKGDAQYSDLCARFLTSNSTPSFLDLNGGTATPVVMPDNTTWLFEAKVVARRVGASDHAAFLVSGCIKRDVGNATVALVGTPTLVTLASTSGALACTAVADTSLGALKIQVTGEVGKNIRWVGKLSLVEVIS